MKSFISRKRITFVLLVILCSVCVYKMFDNWEESDEYRPRDSAEKRYYKTKKELELTKAVPRIDNKPCKSGQPLSVFIYSAAQSQGKYFDKRQATRNTWVSELKKLNVSVYFVVALNENQTINEELRGEADKYEDIIQFSFIDSYYNLTLKTISILRWIQKRCQTSTHILKADDDILVNSPMLLDKLSEFRTGISGSVFVKYQPHRAIDDKWYIPSSVYPYETYPTYVSGGAYMMSGNISHIFLKTIDEYFGFILYFEDLFITGIIAEKAGIERHSTHLISYYVGCKDVCTLYESPVIFQCNDSNEMQTFWSKWKTTCSESCKSISTSSVSTTSDIQTQRPSLKITIFVVIFLVIVGAVVMGLGFYYIEKQFRK